MNAYLSHYQNTQVSTASPEQVLILLYDGAIRFLCQAQQAIETGDIPMRAEKINKVVAIVTELDNSLDHEIGGEIAQHLDALYNFMIRELLTANLRNDAKRLKVVEALLTDLRRTWMQAIEINRQQTAEQKEAAIKAEPARVTEYRQLNAAL
ncbi:MAG: flagellar export chaperone FliS [Deltaproteobacteria bacterium RIFOXYD12_FULL_57_12]|nr:MAG: flagellar export chaperone FliS [Deltaproteobacteria bacterium RIFOXYD12_FULL_57_12]